MEPAPQQGTTARHQHPLIFIAIFLVLALGMLGVVVASQGVPDTGSGETPGPPVATDCPRGTPEGFSLSDIEGKTLDEAEQWAAGADMTIRVVSEDGEPKAATMDYRPDRINVQVEAGVVTRYCGNG